MFKHTKTLIAAAGLTAGLFIGTAQAAPFGNPEDTAFASTLWQALTTNRLVGKNAFHTRPYEGVAPHGAILETIDGVISVGGHSGQAIVKKNFGGEGVDIDAVANNPGKHLGALTVMFKREAGYDTENKDWFWVKYGPDGSVMKNPDGMSLAGRVAKDMDAGCIACHTNADGGDMVYNNDRK